MEPTFFKPGYVDELGNLIPDPPRRSASTHGRYVLWQRRGELPTSIDHTVTDEWLGANGAHYPTWRKLRRGLDPWASLSGDEIEQALCQILGHPIRLWRVIKMRHTLRAGAKYAFFYDHV